MDLTKLTTDLSDTGAVLELRHPDSADIIEGMTMTMLGVDSEVYAKRAHEKTVANISRAQKKGRRALDPEDLARQNEEATIEDLVALTKGWTGFEEDGVELDCSPENVRRILKTRGLSWIRKQAEDFVNDIGNFISKQSEA